ncbi:hypothetical protein MVEN_00223600 [Mycena venus]|uniref:Uncharacterized protein n=1 Tax=Mycena venus TaxID=2733690 RepID=A0A8H6Z182_9AGAR|nr:hypothetical protein MVEN_00223600 [Mycena venus]
MTIHFPKNSDTILDHLASDSASLKTCALVCRVWVIRSGSVKTSAQKMFLQPAAFYDIRAPPFYRIFAAWMSSEKSKDNSCSNEIAAELHQLTRPDAPYFRRR